ncbi:MAG TPA: histidine phosphatase family protein [Candidatus Dormibacteraeota bacterium]
MPTQQVVLVRHGETEWSKDGRHTGTSDIPLTEHGREEARRLKPELQHWRFALVLSSPLQRSVETCRLAGYGDGVQLRPDLVEWDYGSYDGKTSKQIEAERPGWSLWRDGGPDGETAEDVARRVDRVIAEVRAVEGNALVFAHGHVLRVLAARWLGEAPADGRLYALDTAALSVLGYEHQDAVISRWNQPPPG